MSENDKSYWVENKYGARYKQSYPFKKACKIAKQDSIEGSTVVHVYLDMTYTPVVIFHSGRRYEPIEAE